MEHWIHLESEQQLLDAIETSASKPVVIFKHSTRCSISSMAMNRLKNAASKYGVVADLYYLDLLSYRPISSLVADTLEVTHESPQLLIVKDVKCVFHTSHGNIREEILESHLN
jgi:bacillithiol system protein YtxJ